MALRIYTPDELAQMTPQERRRLFDERVITDLSKVPPAYLQRIRDKFAPLVAEQETTDRA